MHQALRGRPSGPVCRLGRRKASRPWVLLLRQGEDHGREGWASCWTQTLTGPLVGTEIETAGVRHNQTSTYTSLIDVSGTVLGFGGTDVNKIDQVQPLPSKLSQACREAQSEPHKIMRWSQCWGSPGGASGEEPACQCRRCKTLGSIPGSGRCPGGEDLPYSCLENPMDRGGWWATWRRRVGHDWSDLARGHGHLRWAWLFPVSAAAEGQVFSPTRPSADRGVGLHLHPAPESWLCAQAGPARCPLRPTPVGCFIVVSPLGTRMQPWPWHELQASWCLFWKGLMASWSKHPVLLECSVFSNCRPPLH